MLPHIIFSQGSVIRYMRAGVTDNPVTERYPDILPFTGAATTPSHIDQLEGFDDSSHKYTLTDTPINVAVDVYLRINSSAGGSMTVYVHWYHSNGTLLATLDQTDITYPASALTNCHAALSFVPADANMIIGVTCAETGGDALIVGNNNANTYLYISSTY